MLSYYISFHFIKSRAVASATIIMLNIAKAILSNCLKVYFNCPINPNKETVPNLMKCITR